MVLEYMSAKNSIQRQNMKFTAVIIQMNVRSFNNIRYLAVLNIARKII